MPRDVSRPQAMWLTPLDDALLAFYRERAAEWFRLADLFNHRGLSDGARDELKRILSVVRPSRAIRDVDEVVHLIEAVCRLDDIANDVQQRTKRRQARRSLQGNPAGKRSNPCLEGLVEGASPLLLRFGVPLSSGENAVLVKALRCMADDFDIKGDPRNELRRLARVRKAEPPPSFDRVSTPR